MGSVKLGAIGPVKGQTWDHQGRTQIVQIIVSYGAENIKSLQFQYMENGNLHTSDIIGCQNFSGSIFETITFNHPHEYITKVEGLYGGSFEKLCIHTNEKVYDVFERSDRSYRYRNRFSFNFGCENQFGGFHGTHDSNGVASIGAYFNHLTALPAGYIDNEPSITGDHEDENQVEVDGEN